MGGSTSTHLLPDAPPSEPLAFPATYSVVANGRAGTLEVLVEALSQEGARVAQARGAVTLVDGRGAYLDLTLVAACVLDVDCDDGSWCDGVERCVEGTCRPADDEERPCPPSLHTCVEQRCLEEADQCSVRVDHGRCAPLTTDDGGTEPTYCDTLTGCTRGHPCSSDAECQDGSTCNGPERCVAGRCMAGIPPSLDDLNPCTVDACVEGVGPAHFPQPDGNRCATAAVAEGICLASECRLSRCGDGFRDLARQEQCDDGADNSDTRPDACRLTCARAACGDDVSDLGEECDDGEGNGEEAACRLECVRARCGDGSVQTGVEECDDGNADESDACLSSCAWNTCGDGDARSGAEECDDGNDADTDACLTTCRWNTCGDSHLLVGVEECDDGNESDDDVCLSACRLNTCGDAHVLVGVEECDDGNVSNADACLVTCRRNACRDGFLLVGVEGSRRGRGTPRPAGRTCRHRTRRRSTPRPRCTSLSWARSRLRSHAPTRHAGRAHGPPRGWVRSR